MQDTWKRVVRCRVGGCGDGDSLVQAPSPDGDKVGENAEVVHMLGPGLDVQVPWGERGGSGWPWGGSQHPPAPLLTCDLPHRPEDIQLLGVQRRDVAPGIPVEPKPSAGPVGGLHPTAPRPPRPSPLQARDEEVQVAQDLGAVHKGVDVAGVHSLVLAAGTSALAGCGTGMVRVCPTVPSAPPSPPSPLPLGHSPEQGSHIFSPFFSTSILSLGQARTQELWSTTKLSARRPSWLEPGCPWPPPQTPGPPQTPCTPAHVGSSGRRCPRTGTWCRGWAPAGRSACCR